MNSFRQLPPCLRMTGDSRECPHDLAFIDKWAVNRLLPFEAIGSDWVHDLLERQFAVAEFRPIGGDLLLALEPIAHNFTENDE